MCSHIVSVKTDSKKLKSGEQLNLQWIKNIGVIPKAMSSSKKGSQKVLIWETTQAENHFGGEHTSEHAHFKVTVQEGKMTDTLLDMLQPKFTGHILES